MTAFRKLFIAAALVATGLGVAYFLGEPVSIKPAFHSPKPSTQPPLVAVAPTRLGVSNSVQLLPDSVGAQVPARAPEPLALAVPFCSAIPAPVIGESLQVSNLDVAVSRPVATGQSNFAPQAQLRNEAPRPIGNEPRSPATIRRAPPVAMDNRGSANNDANRMTSTWPAPQLLSVGFSSDVNSTPATTAAYEVPANVTNDRQIGPPPWPAAGEHDGPRMHVIADGDSLEKLAGRYLDDPRRSAEIYELNREVLSNPDLLPIGAELKMPERSARTSWERQGRRAGVSTEASVREAAYGNLVPVRATSSNDGVIPRAQLARPLPVE